MTTHNQRWGEYGENISSAYLKKAGYKIIARNWRCHRQEIDLIVKQQTTLVLIEVKLRLSNSFGSASESLNSRKLQQLKLAAACFLKQYPNSPWRYDFIAIDCDIQRQLARLSHYRQII